MEGLGVIRGGTRARWAEAAEVVEVFGGSCRYFRPCQGESWATHIGKNAVFPVLPSHLRDAAVLVQKGLFVAEIEVAVEMRQ